MITVYFTMLDERAKEPVNAYGSDAGWDLFVLEDVTIEAGKGMDVRTGIAVEVPEGYYVRIVPRSSAFRKRGLLVLEGIIDAGFRGELFSFCYVPPLGMPRHGPQAVKLKAGESVAQMIVQPVPAMQLRRVERLSQSVRGERGFGSSGH